MVPFDFYDLSPCPVSFRRALRPVMEDKRESSRHRTFKGGTISFDRGLVDCTVRNLSDGGALLEVGSSVGIPNQFILIIKPETIRKSCEVKWRSEKNIGVKFA
jgi:hypothetical protein